MRRSPLPDFPSSLVWILDISGPGHLGTNLDISVLGPGHFGTDLDISVLGTDLDFSVLDSSGLGWDNITYWPQLFGTY